MISVICRARERQQEGAGRWRDGDDDDDGGGPATELVFRPQGNANMTRLCGGFMHRSASSKAQ